MQKVLKLNKNLGETPLECLERFRVLNPEYANEKMTYAGRLDPMAEGLLIVLVGEECKKKDEYLGLDKEYIFEVLLGIKTDTYDILGLPFFAQAKDFNLEDFIGKHTQEYPPYSSKTIDGVPLFQKSKDGEEFQSPTKEIEIYSLDKIKEREISAREALAEISRRIILVTGDFRQEEILKAWQKLLENSKDNFKIIEFKINCSSGTYVRSVCNKMGGIAYSINRTKIFF